MTSTRDTLRGRAIRVLHVSAILGAALALGARPASAQDFVTVEGTITWGGLEMQSISLYNGLGNGSDGAGVTTFGGPSAGQPTLSGWYNNASNVPANSPLNTSITVATCPYFNYSCDTPAGPAGVYVSYMDNFTTGSDPVQQHDIAIPTGFVQGSLVVPPGVTIGGGYVSLSVYGNADINVNANVNAPIGSDGVINIEIPAGTVYGYANITLNPGPNSIDIRGFVGDFSDDSHHLAPGGTISITFPGIAEVKGSVSWHGPMNWSNITSAQLLGLVSLSPPTPLDPSSQSGTYDVFVTVPANQSLQVQLSAVDGSQLSFTAGTISLDQTAAGTTVTLPDAPLSAGYTFADVSGTVSLIAGTNGAGGFAPPGTLSNGSLVMTTSALDENFNTITNSVPVSFGGDGSYSLKIGEGSGDANVSATVQECALQPPGMDFPNVSITTTPVTGLDFALPATYSDAPDGTIAGVINIPAFQNTHPGADAYGSVNIGASNSIFDCLGGNDSYVFTDSNSSFPPGLPLSYSFSSLTPDQWRFDLSARESWSGGSRDYDLSGSVSLNGGTVTESLDLSNPAILHADVDLSGWGVLTGTGDEFTLQVSAVNSAAGSGSGSGTDTGSSTGSGSGSGFSISSDARADLNPGSGSGSGSGIGVGSDSGSGIGIGTGSSSGSGSSLVATLDLVLDPNDPGPWSASLYESRNGAFSGGQGYWNWNVNTPSFPISPGPAQSGPLTIPPGMLVTGVGYWTLNLPVPSDAYLDFRYWSMFGAVAGVAISFDGQVGTSMPIQLPPDTFTSFGSFGDFFSSDSDPNGGGFFSAPMTVEIAANDVGVQDFYGPLVTSRTPPPPTITNPNVLFSALVQGQMQDWSQNALQTVSVNGQSVFSASDTPVYSTTVSAPLTFHLGAGNTVTIQATDANGNTTTWTRSYTGTDITPPVIAQPPDISVDCSPNLLVPVTFPLPSATDDWDPAPVVTCTPSSGSGFPVGATTVLVTATDASGNSSQTSFTVTRAPMKFVGFLAPLSGTGTYAKPAGTFKLGSTIPVKFQIFCDGAQVTSGVERVRIAKFTSATQLGDPIDATPTGNSSTGDECVYGVDHWQFNLNTKGLTTGIYDLQVDLSDGSVGAGVFQLK
jgi:hypothetical protein